MDLNKILLTYSISEILEYSDLEEVEALRILIMSGNLTLPPIPVDAYYDPSN